MNPKLQTLYGLVEKGAHGLVHMAVWICGEPLRELRGSEVSLRNRWRASCFLRVFLSPRSIGNLLHTLLQTQKALHVRIIGCLIVFLLQSATGRDNLLRRLEGQLDGGGLHVCIVRNVAEEGEERRGVRGELGQF